MEKEYQRCDSGGEMNLFTYRGKRLDNGKWAYGDLVRHSKSLLIREHKEGGSWAEHLIDPSTIGVCCGMKDNNGIDVYTVRVDILQIIDETLRVCRKIKGFKKKEDTAENCYSMASSNERT